jgi:hypothetical protein
MQFPLFFIALMAILTTLTLGKPISKDEYESVVGRIPDNALAETDFFGNHTISEIVITDGAEFGKVRVPCRLP